MRSIPRRLVRASVLKTIRQRSTRRRVATHCTRRTAGRPVTGQSGAGSGDIENANARLSWGRGPDYRLPDAQRQSKELRPILSYRCAINVACATGDDMSASHAERNFPVLRVADEPGKDDPAEARKRMLKQLAERLDQHHAFAKGQFVAWKPALNPALSRERERGRVPSPVHGRRWREAPDEGPPQRGLEAVAPASAGQLCARRAATNSRIRSRSAFGATIVTLGPQVIR